MSYSPGSVALLPSPGAIIIEALRAYGVFCYSSGLPAFPRAGRNFFPRACGRGYPFARCAGLGTVVGAGLRRVILLRFGVGAVSAALAPGSESGVTLLRAFFWFSGLCVAGSRFAQAGCLRSVSGRSRGLFYGVMVMLSNCAWVSTTRMPAKPRV